MKKVLVTGASGSIGKNVIKYLLSEGKYEITALDLKNKGSIKRLRRYRRRVNVIFGDVTDPILMDALVKDHDYVIHLAGVMPPIADIKRNLCHIIDYKGTENIIRSINYFNPKCFLIYPSTTTVYGQSDQEITVKTKVKINENNYYTSTKYEVEKLINNKLDNYTILRLPICLSMPNEEFAFNGIMDEKIECVTSLDAAYALVKCISHTKEIKGKTFNLGGGKNSYTTYRELIINILKYYGLSFKFIVNRLFVDKNFHCHVYKDSDSLEDILHYRNDSIYSYYMRLKRRSRKRTINKVLAKPIIFILKRKTKKER